MNKHKNLYKTIGKVLTVISVLLSTCYTIIAYLKASTYAPLYFGIGVLVLLSLMTIIKDGYFVEQVFKFLNIFKKSPMKGIWNIEIVYQNEEGKNCYRTGNCEFIDTVFGISIKGGNILDKTTKKMEVDYWLADNVDVYSVNNGNKVVNHLIYHYNIFADKGNTTPVKAGFVIATEENGVYTGQFEDFVVGEGKTERKGTVTLFIAK